MSSAPVQLFLGSDPSILSRLAEEAINAYGATENNVMRNPRDMNSLYSASLFGENQAIVITEPDAATIKALCAYSDAPLDDRIVIVTSTKAQAALKKTVLANGGEVAEPSKKAADTVNSLLGRVNLTPQAKQFIVDTTGESVSLVPALLDTLQAVYGGNTVDVDDVRPWITTGSLPIWSLTGAIDSGNVVESLSVLDRIWNEASPVAIVGALKAHMYRIFVVQQANIRDEQVAATILGMKGSTYPAKKAIMLASRYGKAVEPLLRYTVDADASLRGGEGRGIPQRILVEVLVGRMCAYPRK